MADQNDINELNLDDLTDNPSEDPSIEEETTIGSVETGPDERSDDVPSDNDTPDVSNHDAPPQPDGELNDPEDASDDPNADEDDTEFNIPGQIPDGENTQDSQQDTYLHQALLYQTRALNELSAAIGENETNYSGLANELKAFFQTFIGRLETVWQNGQVNASQADSLEQDPIQGTYNKY